MAPRCTMNATAPSRRRCLVQPQAAGFIARVEAGTGSELPRFIEDEFDAFLEYSVLATAS